MAARGLTYSAVPFDVSTELVSGESGNGITGLSIEQAKANAYRSAQPATSDPSVVAANIANNDLVVADKKFDSALNDDNAGCLVAAQKDLITRFGLTAMDFYLQTFSAIASRIATDGSQSSPLLQKQEMWHACIVDRGYNAKTRTDLAALAEKSANGTTTPTADEVAIAVADAECDQSSGMTAEMNAIGHSAVAAWLAANRDQLVAARKVEAQEAALLVAAAARL